jgi:hypothetical protein
MTRRIVTCLAVLALMSCRDYQYESKLTDQDGLVPPDQFARYGVEQAEAVAIGREYGYAEQGTSAADLTKQADAAVAYAGTLPNVADARADPLGHRLTVRFKSGWKVGIPPIKDGKRGSDTPGIKPVSGAPKP